MQQITTTKITIPTIPKITIPKPKLPAYTPPKLPPPKVPPPPVIPDWIRKMKAVKKPEKQPGYNVFAKVLGRRKKIAGNVRRRSALSRGAIYTDRTPAASFTIKSTGRVASGPDIFGWKHLKRKFRASKKHKGVFVEKKRYRIDSIGEMMGLAKAKKAGGYRKKGLDLRKVL